MDILSFTDFNLYPIPAISGVIGRVLLGLTLFASFILWTAIFVNRNSPENLFFTNGNLNRKGFLISCSIVIPFFISLILIAFSIIYNVFLAVGGHIGEKPPMVSAIFMISLCLFALISSLAILILICVKMIKELKYHKFDKT